MRFENTDILFLRIPICRNKDSSRLCRAQAVNRRHYVDRGMKQILLVFSMFHMRHQHMNVLRRFPRVKVTLTSRIAYESIPYNLSPQDALGSCVQNASYILGSTSGVVCSSCRSSQSSSTSINKPACCPVQRVNADLSLPFFAEPCLVLCSPTSSSPSPLLSSSSPRSSSPKASTAKAAPTAETSTPLPPSYPP